MQNIVREEFGDCTSVTVAHRLDTIADSDMVAVLNEGRLVEFGAPSELMKRGSMFGDLNGA